MSGTWHSVRMEKRLRVIVWTGPSDYGTQSLENRNGRKIRIVPVCYHSHQTAGTMVSVSWEDKINLWDSITGEHKKTFAMHPDCSTTGAAFSPDGKAVCYWQ